MTMSGTNPSNWAGRSWNVEVRSGSAQELHDLGDPSTAVRTARVMHPTGPAVVLGSSQADTDIDVAAATAGGFAMARRRSGGGAVLVVPGAQVWIDLLIPRGDPLWDDDIVKAATWVGEAWVAGLAMVGLSGAEVHRGRLTRTRWAARACFAGMGPGEVSVGGRKVMGLSQRRSRDWTKIQTAVHTDWRPEPLVAMLTLGPAESADCLQELRRSVSGVRVDGDLIVRSLLSAIPD